VSDNVEFHQALFFAGYLSARITPDRNARPMAGEVAGGYLLRSPDWARRFHSAWRWC